MPQNRYNRVFMLPEHLHCQGFPFEVEAGALLVDTKTNGVLAQLKMASYVNLNVKAVKVFIQPEDTRGEPLGDVVTYQYLDLNITRGTSFGQKTPIYLPDNSSRSFSIVSIEVVYSDNSIAASDGLWEPIPAQKTLAETISDQEILKQYRVDYGDSCLYSLQELGDIWRCTCGAVNRNDEDVCHSCGHSLEELRSVDFSVLEEHKAVRLEAERVEREAQAERERLEKAEAEKKAGESKRAKKIVGAIGILLAVAIVGFVVFMNNRTPGKADFGPDTLFDMNALEAMSADDVERYAEASTLNFKEETSRREDGYHVYGFNLGGELDKALHLRTGYKFALTDDDNNDFTCIMWYTTPEFGKPGSNTTSELQSAARNIVYDIAPYLGLENVAFQYTGKGPDGATDWVVFCDKGGTSGCNYIGVKFYSDGAAIVVANKM